MLPGPHDIYYYITFMSMSFTGVDCATIAWGSDNNSDYYCTENELPEYIKSY
jgi:hypothetical protein